MRFLIRWLIDWPESIARHFASLGPLVARVTVGWVFMITGWGKLNNLPQVIENFAGWGIPFPEIMTPFVSAVEFGGGLLLLLGLFTRIAAAPLIVVMIVAIISAKRQEIDSLDALLGFEEFSYMVMFLWLAIAGPGLVSADRLLQRWKKNAE